MTLKVTPNLKLANSSSEIASTIGGLLIPLSRSRSEQFQQGTEIYFHLELLSAGPWAAGRKVNGCEHDSHVSDVQVCPS
jgi:hypothetical protein